MKITLIRHGKPKTPSLEKISASEFGEWVSAYNKSGLCPSSHPPKETLKQANICDVIVCSALPRSIYSAKALNAEKILLSDALFNEADLPIANWRTLKLSPKLWAITFRTLWFFGYARHSKSLKETKLRSAEAIKRLTELAQKYDHVLFVGHGVYNRMLANELRRTGWSGPKNPDVKHWQFGVYEYRTGPTIQQTDGFQ